MRDVDGTSEGDHRRENGSHCRPVDRYLHRSTPLGPRTPSRTWFQSFEPVSLQLPPVLFPVVNIPLIDYTLEWLAANEVDEVV